MKQPMYELAGMTKSEVDAADLDSLRNICKEYHVLGTAGMPDTEEYPIYNGTIRKPKQFFVEMNPASSDAYNQEITWRIEHLATGISHGPYNFSTVALPVQLLQGPQVLHMYDNALLCALKSNDYLQMC